MKNNLRLSGYSMDVFFIALLFVMIMSCDSMQYKDQITSEDISKMFNDDGCIEGTLSMLDLGTEFFEPISIIESKSDKKTDPFGGKTPMSLLHELATYNNIQHKYELTGEEGPAHKKKFLISLNLGEENYIAEGNSIKKAQHEAAKLALNSTLYEHPPFKTPDYVKSPKINKSPVETLNEWAKKHGNAVITYSFNEQTKLGHRDNHYHKGMYSKGHNVYRVLVKVFDQEFTGEGASADEAKQNAAKNALNKFQKSEAFCMFDDGIKKLFTTIFTDSKDSPISLVNQFGSKSKLETSFDLVLEEGPAHIKRFEYKCKVGEFETIGEGSSKKEAKTDAALAMLNLLKSSIPYDNKCLNVVKKKSKKKAKNLVKSVVQSNEDKYQSDESDFSHHEETNPISKLYQLQQFKHAVEPIFRLVEGKGYPNTEFHMEVVIGEVSFIGSGPSKKIAKKKAAEGVLLKLGYSSKSGSTRISNNNDKKKEFQIDSSSSNEKPLMPGMNMKSEKFSKLEETNEISNENVKPKRSYETSSKTNKEHVKSQHDNIKQHGKKNSDRVQDHHHNHQYDDHHANDVNQQKYGTNAKAELKKMADQMRIRYQFSDFPKSNNKGFISLVSLTTEPPKICYGEGLSPDYSQEKAAITALKSLYKSQLNTLTKMLQDQSEKSVSNQELYITEKEAVSFITTKETE